MYVFSANAIAETPVDDFAAGDPVPFIVYINFKDLYGAEQLCKLYLRKEGFRDPSIEKRKLIEDRYLTDKKLVAADPSLYEALTSGYAIQIFSAH